MRRTDAGPTPMGAKLVHHQLRRQRARQPAPGDAGMRHNNTTIDFSQLTCSTITLTTGALSPIPVPTR